MKFPFSFWGNPAGTVIARRSVATDPHAAIKVATASTVDWGDGTPLEAATANVQLNHVYTALGEMTVTITAVAPAAMNPDLSLKHPASTATDAGWKEVIIRDPHMTNFTVKPNSSLRELHVEGQNKWVTNIIGNFNLMPDLESVSIHTVQVNEFQGVCDGNTNLKRFSCNTPANTSTAYAFRGCKMLELVQWDLSKMNTPTYMFNNAHLAWNPDYDLPLAVNIGHMFFFTTGVTAIKLTGTTNVTTISSFLEGCTATTINRMDFTSLKLGGAAFRMPNLVHHPGYIGELTQDVSYMFYGCSLLETIGDIGMANVTNTTQIFSGCPKLRSFTLRGLKVSININGLKLDATALDAVFTSLGTANAGATINITGNPGAATCDKTIATSKGWGVTG